RGGCVWRTCCGVGCRRGVRAVREPARRGSWRGRGACRSRGRNRRRWGRSCGCPLCLLFGPCDFGCGEAGDVDAWEFGGAAFEFGAAEGGVHPRVGGGGEPEVVDGLLEAGGGDAGEGRAGAECFGEVLAPLGGLGVLSVVGVDGRAHGCIPSAAICLMRCSIASCAAGRCCCHARSWLMSVEAATVSGVTGLVGLGASVRGSTVNVAVLPREMSMGTERRLLPGRSVMWEMRVPPVFSLPKETVGSQ